MKFFLFVLLAGSSLAACQKVPSPSEAFKAEKIGGALTFELPYKQSATVPTGDAGTAQATLADVKDSRCPRNVTCVWAGRADVVLTLTDATAPSQTVPLSLTGYSPAADSVAISLNRQGYWLRLLAVNPYPSTATASQPQSVTVRLRPR